MHNLLLYLVVRAIENEGDLLDPWLKILRREMPILTYSGLESLWPESWACDGMTEDSTFTVTQSTTE